MRTINVRLLVILALAGLLTAALAYWVREVAVRRNADVLLREAALAKKRKDNEAAIDYLSRYVALVPNNSSLAQRAELALLQADSGRGVQAYGNLESVLREAPQRDDVRRRLIEIAVWMGRYPDARHHLDVLLEKSPKDVELLDLSARCQIAIADYETAKKTLLGAIEIDPARLETYLLLVLMRHDRLKDAAGALSVLDEMVKKNPANYQAYLVRGAFRLDHQTDRQAAAIANKMPAEEDSASSPTSEDESSGLKAAAADADEALKIAPDTKAVIVFAVRCFVAIDDLEKAAEVARHGLELYPKNASMFAALASVESKAGNRREAISWLKRGLASADDKEKSDLLWNLTNLLIDEAQIDNKQIVEAQKAIKRLREIKIPKPYPNALLDYLASRLLVEQSKWLEASQKLESLRPALAKWPDLLKQADFWLGQCYEALGRSDLQLTAYRRAAGIDSRWLAARLGIARALLASGRIDEAIEEYGQLVKLPSAPLGLWAQFARLLVIVNLRRKEDERDWDTPARILKSIEKVDPDSESVPILRAEILVAQGENDAAEALLLDKTVKYPKVLDFWLGLVALAERRGDWERAQEILGDVEASLGDSVKIRLARARHLVNRDRTSDKDSLHTSIRALARPNDMFTESDQTRLFADLAALTLAIEDYDETERLCNLVAEREPLNLSVRLVLFDLAYRAKKPAAMAKVLDEVKQIEKSGPLWHYGEAIRLTVIAMQDHRPELYAKAKANLSEARIARPAWSKVPLLLGQINDSLGDEETAISNFKEAIDLGERSPAMISRTVVLLYQRQRFSDADQLIRRLQEQQSPFTYDMTRLAADVSLRMKDTELALDLVKLLKTAASSSNDPKEYLLAGQILSALRRDEEAEENYREAIKLDGTSAAAWICLIQHLGRTRQTPDDVEDALKEAQEKIKPAEAPEALAKALESIGRIDAAEAHYRDALDLAPDDPPVIRRLVEFYLRHGKLQAAEPLLSGLLPRLKDASDDDRIWCRRSLALARIAPGRGPRDATVTKKALALLEENLAVNPRPEDDLRAKAMLLAASADRPARREAAEILEKLVGAQKSVATEGTAESRFVLAQLYAGLGDMSKAAAHWRSLMVSDGNNPRYLAYYIQFLLKRNEVGEAALWLQNLLKLAPQDSSTWTLETEIQFRQAHYDELLTTIDRFIENHAANESDQPLVVVRSAELLELFAKRLETLKDSSESEGASRAWAERFIERADGLYRKQSQDRPEDVWALAAFLGRRERHSDSLDILEKELDQARPDNIAAVTSTLLMSTAATVEHYLRAEKLLRAALDQHARPFRLLLALADLQNMWGKYDDAESLYREVLAKQPQNPGALNNLALLLALRGRGRQESIAMIDKAIEVAGPIPTLLDSRATIRLALGDPKGALTDVEESLASRPVAVAFFHQAQVERKLGKGPAVKVSLEKAKELGLRVVELHPLERPIYQQMQNEVR